MPTLEKLVDGYKIYKATMYEKHKDLLTHQLRAGIKPTTLVITSSDMQIPVDVLTGSTPGDLYIIRHKAGLIPPFYNPEELDGFAATLEYAVEELQVQNILVLGHSHNDGLQTILDGDHKTSGSDPLRAWLGIASGIYEAIKRDLPNASREMQEKALELESIVMGIRNLFSYPWIESRVNAKKLELYGWHFDLESGTLLCYMPNEGVFSRIE